MKRLFDNQSYLSQVVKHNQLPIYITYEFDFIRCVCVEEWVYGKTVSELHSGNLRKNDQKGRYSKLFPNEKISYWADSKDTALAEIRRHGGHKNYLTFWAYDDKTSTFPILDVDEDLVIIDGRILNFHQILLKVEMGEELTIEEKELVHLIEKEKPDCLAYRSMANKGGVNFLFFEKGFKKLALRETKLYMGENKNKVSNKITSAFSSDYSPNLESYGKCFEPIAKVKMNKEYLNTDEYKLRCINYNKSLGKI